MRPKSIKQAVTTTENTLLLGAAVKSVLIKNVGPSDVQIDFDQAISDDAYLCEAGETLIIGDTFSRLHFKGAGTSTFYIIKIVQ